MRTAETSVVILSSLAAIAQAEVNMAQLTPEDVPFRCLTICGPIVELTGICHIGSHGASKLKRRKVEKRVIINGLGQVGQPVGQIGQPGQVAAVIPAQRVQVGVAPQVAQGAGRVTRVVTRTAPAIAAQALSKPTNSIIPNNPFAASPVRQPVVRPSRVAPAVVNPSPQPPLAVPFPGVDDDDDPNAFPTTTPLAVGNAAMPADDLGVATLSAGMAMADMDMNMQKKEAEAIEAAEEECICLNRSFDVPLVAPLCASCIEQAGVDISPMFIIMDQCNFTETTYTPARQSVVNNVRVSATRPTLLSANGNAMVSAAPGSFIRAGSGSLLSAMAAGVVCGLALML